MITLIAFFDENGEQKWVSFDDVADFLEMADNDLPFRPDIQPHFEVAMVVVGDEVNTSLPTILDVIAYARKLIEANS